MALTDSCVRYYKLDEPSGTTVTDSCGNYNATNSGLDVNYTGKIGKAYSGDGTNIRYADINKTMPTAGSISFWVNYRSFTESSGSWRYCANAGPDNWNILRVGSQKGATQGIPLYSLYDGGDYSITGSESLATATWYHYVVSWGNLGMRFFVNNSSVGTNSYTGNGDGNQGMRIGSNQATQAGYFPNGLIDEFGVWDRQLSTDEISSLYNGGSGLTYPFTGGGTSASGSDTSTLSDSASVGVVSATPTGSADRDCFYVNNNGSWVQFQDFEYFKVIKTMNQLSEFEVKLYDIQDTQKTYFKEKAEVIFFVGTTKILKGRIQTIDYASTYECIAKGYGMEVKLLDKDLIKSGDKRVEYDNISAQTIAKEILSTNTDGVSPWIINPGTDGLFTSDYGNTTLRFEYANRLNAIGALCNAISYEWECYQSVDYLTDYLRIKNLLGTQTSVKTFNIAGASANCEKTERNIDMNNMCNYISCLGYGDGINQIQTSTYSASTIYSVLASDITASATSITLADASSFPSSGEIRIMEERITYTGKSSNTLTGCTRGYGSTTAKSHKINCYVEKYYTKTSPETGSSIQLYGIMDYTLINRDIMDVDTLEVIASGYLLDRMTPIVSLKVISNEPMTDITALTIGDKITIVDAESGLNGDYRIVGLEYSDNYGELTLEISASNRSLEFIEQMNKAREDQQNMQKYMQGATNIYALMETTEGDSTHYIENRFYMPSEVVALNKVLLNFKMKAVKALKVVRETAVANYSESNIDTTYQDISGASVTVHPHATDVVLLMTSGYSYSEEDASTGMDIRMTRDGTEIYRSEQRSRADPGVCSYIYLPYSKVMLETPGEGTITYKTQAQSEHGTEDIRMGHMSAVVFSTGFEEGSLSSPSVSVYIGEDGGTMSLFGTYTTDQSNLDITSAVEAIGTSKWVNIQFRPNQEMRIEMNAYVKMFLESD